MKKQQDKDIDAIILKAVKEGIKAGRSETFKYTNNAYKDTEKRLYAYNVLLQKIENDKEKLKELKTHGLQETSKGITRYDKSGTRLDKDDVLEALIQDLEITIQIDSHEVAAMTDALRIISDDTYYVAIEGRFIRNLHDNDIAEEKYCDPSTIRRNRIRLIRKLAIWLYGVQAI